jgi:hypothetical protein
MTEAEWLAAEDLFEMLRFINQHNGNNRRKAGRRKLRLFGCASLRCRWELLPDPRSRYAVEVAERLADGLARNDEVEQASAQAGEVGGKSWDQSSDWNRWQDEQHAAHCARLVLDAQSGYFSWVACFPTLGVVDISADAA